MKMFFLIILTIFSSPKEQIEVSQGIPIHSVKRIRMTLNLENCYTGPVRESIEIIKEMSDNIIVNRYICSEKRMACFTEYFESGAIKSFSEPDSLINSIKVTSRNQNWDNLNRLINVTPTLSNSIDSFDLSKYQSWIYIEKEGYSWYSIKDEYFNKYSELINLSSQE